MNTAIIILCEAVTRRREQLTTIYPESAQDQRARKERIKKEIAELERAIEYFERELSTTNSVLTHELHEEIITKILNKKS